MLVHQETPHILNENKLPKRNKLKLVTCGSYKATELHVPKAIKSLRLQERTCGVRFAQHATWHVVITGIAIFAVTGLPGQRDTAAPTNPRPCLQNLHIFFSSEIAYNFIDIFKTNLMIY